MKSSASSGTASKSPVVNVQGASAAWYSEKSRL